MASKKQTLDRAIKQAKDLAASLKLIEQTIGTVPNAQKEAACILARLETLRDLKLGPQPEDALRGDSYPKPPQAFLDRFSDRSIED